MGFEAAPAGSHWTLIGECFPERRTPLNHNYGTVGQSVARMIEAAAHHLPRTLDRQD
jgi:hypothetical protein